MEVLLALTTMKEENDSEEGKALFEEAISTESTDKFHIYINNRGNLEIFQTLSISRAYTELKKSR